MANRQHGKHVIPERKETSKATRRVVPAPSRPWHREQALVESGSLPELGDRVCSEFAGLHIANTRDLQRAPP